MMLKFLDDEIAFYGKADGVLDGIPFEHVAHIMKVVRDRLSALDQPSGVRTELRALAERVRALLLVDVPAAWAERLDIASRLEALSALDLSAIGAEGWKLVPVEPTPEMLAAFWRQKNVGTQTIGPIDTSTMDCSDYAAYRAMLAAAPSPPEPR